LQIAARGFAPHSRFHTTKKEVAEVSLDHLF